MVFRFTLSFSAYLCHGISKQNQRDGGDGHGQRPPGTAYILQVDIQAKSHHRHGKNEGGRLRNPIFDWQGNDRLSGEFSFPVHSP